MRLVLRVPIADHQCHHGVYKITFRRWPASHAWSTWRWLLILSISAERANHFYLVAPIRTPFKVQGLPIACTRSTWRWFIQTLTKSAERRNTLMDLLLCVSISEHQHVTSSSLTSHRERWRRHHPSFRSRGFNMSLGYLWLCHFIMTSSLHHIAWRQATETYHRLVSIRVVTCSSARSIFIPQWDW